MHIILSLPASTVQLNILWAACDVNVKSRFV